MECAVVRFPPDKTKPGLIGGDAVDEAGDMVMSNDDKDPFNEE